MKTRAGLTALVTGPTSGIGKEMALLLAKQGLSLVLVSRSRKKLDALQKELSAAYGVSVEVIPADLSREGAVVRLLAELKRRKITVDVLVNNAGVGLMGRAIRLDPAEKEGMLRLNMLSLTALADNLAAEMAGRKKGWILNVGSLVGLFPVPFFASYSASKAYVYHYSLALRAEMKGSGVSVTCLLPGFVRTGFDDAAHITSGTYRMFSRLFGMGPERVARIGLRAMWSRRAKVVAGVMNSIGAFKMGFLPKTFLAELTASGLKKLLPGD